MKNVKKLLALGLAAVMSLSLVACGGGADTDTNATGAAGDGANAGNADGGTRSIYIGCWWEQAYDSDDAMEDSGDWIAAQDAEGDSADVAEQKAYNRNVAQLKFDNVATIESTYNVEFYWQNLTHTGVQESINVSILAGSPDCDIYMVEPGMGIPAQLNGLALDLRTVLPEDHDLFTTQTNCAYLDLGDGKVCLFKRVNAEDKIANSYPLCFNVQLLEDNNLEDPRDLWERGEWTWDKFNEYMQILTQDTDGDGQIDQYGYCGYEGETFEQLVMANGASIAPADGQEQLSSAATGEALQQMYDMYNTFNVCYPYDFEGTPSDSMRIQYRNGNIGFWPISCWIHTSNGDDYDWDASGDPILPFDRAYVRWPVGPSGDKETNAAKNAVNGEYYIIPNGIQDPETVFNVMYDFWNWYGGDTSVRDNKQVLNWWYNCTSTKEELQNANFAVMEDCGAHTTFDLWNSMSISYDLQSLIKGEMTPAQFQETYKQQVQDGLDAYFN